MSTELEVAIRKVLVEDFSEAMGFNESECIGATKSHFCPQI